MLSSLTGEQTCRRWLLLIFWCASARSIDLSLWFCFLARVVRIYRLGIKVVGIIIETMFGTGKISGKIYQLIGMWSRQMIVLEVFHGFIIVRVLDLSMIKLTSIYYRFCHRNLYFFVSIMIPRTMSFIYSNWENMNGWKIRNSTKWVGLSLNRITNKTVNIIEFFFDK